MRQAGDPASDLSLPNLTGFLATDAKRDGGFGLVGPPITIAYHEMSVSYKILEKIARPFDPVKCRIRILYIYVCV